MPHHDFAAVHGVVLDLCHVNCLYACSTVVQAYAEGACAFKSALKAAAWHVSHSAPFAALTLRLSF